MENTNGIKQEQVTQEQELTLEAWDTLTQEQREALKASLIKSKYGIGGEHLSTFPTTLDNKINPWVEETYQISKLPSRVTETTFKDWEANGGVKIIPLEVGTTINYLVVLLPNKPLKMDIWTLQNGETKPYTKYTDWSKLDKQLTFNKGHYHITNIYTNKNKAFNQAKNLVKLFKLGQYNFKALENWKEVTKMDYYKKDLTPEGKIIIQKIGKNTGKPTGKTWNTLEDLTGRKPHGQIGINYLEHIQ